MTCTAPCTAPAPHTQKPAPHLHRTRCVLSPYNPLRCVQGCTASRRLAGTLYALVASRDEADTPARLPSGCVVYPPVFIININVGGTADAQASRDRSGPWRCKRH